MPRRRFIWLLILGVIFCVNSASAKLLEKKKPRLPTKADRQERIKQRVTDLSVKLSLSEQQAKKITDLLNRSKEETERLLEETGKKIVDLKLQTEKNLQAILTEEQRDKYNKIYQKEQEEDEDLMLFKSEY